MNRLKITSTLYCLSAILLAQPLGANQAKQLPDPVVADPEIYVPLDSWVYPAYEKMSELQYIYGCRLPVAEPPALTRFEFAYVTSRFRRQEIWKNIKGSPEFALLGEAGVKDTIAALEREFQPEIARMVPLTQK